MSSPMRQGFTLIELTMAIVIGSIILFAAMGMFQTMERADSIADVRAEENSQLQRTQRVASRAMGSLLVMSRQDQQTASAARTAQEQAEQAVADGRGLGGGQDEASEQETLDGLADTVRQFRPRVLLEPDPRLQGVQMVRRVRIGDEGLGAPESTTPQRLELALSAPCVIPSYADEQRRLAIARLGLRPIEIGSSVDEEGAVRGAFVFRDERRVNQLGLRVFSFWWLPIAGDADDAEAIEAEQLDPAIIDGAVMLMDSVVWARWRFFKEAQWRDEFQVLGELDLAAYGELEMTTSQNVTVSWLFELAWTIGTDSDDEGDGDAEGEEELDLDPESGGGTTSSGDGSTRQGSVN
ncbi:MAG: prepilin-type N-terminal cleavage/methylation domain-containing protein [Phycisphaera sp.]|nr:MAG: prepilin-type N-terminal cleavage/methylation domain-containing protein [Phycisphaera sp.]